MGSSPRRPARSALCTASLRLSTRLRSRTLTLVRRAVTSSTVRSPRTALRTTPRGLPPTAAATSSTSRSLACTTSCTLLRTPSASGTTAPTAVAARPQQGRGGHRVPGHPHSPDAYGRGDHLVGQRLGAWRHRFGGRRPCPVGLQHAPHRGRHQRAGLSSIYTTYAHVSLRGIGLPSCVIFAWTSCILLTANCQCSDKTKSV